ncbi:MAG: class I SAM-dependent methyltransferase [Acidimicrobiales bacterium]|nr:class I SAM-dependent methyltransferase [Acidimicrobiales bacterium]
MHWLRSQFAVYSIEDLVALDTPWWTYKAIDEVESWLEQRPKTVVFEWGSGASTVWLQKRATSVTSVEHDETFSSIVQPYLGDNSTLLVRPGVSSEHPRIGSAKRGFTQLDFTAYVEAIDEVEGKFDLIVIDGRARSVCLERATSRLNDGGIIVFDNSHRRRYQDALGGTHLRLSRTRGLTPASPYPTETSLLRR